MRVRKIIIGAVIALLAIVQTVAYGWTMIADDSVRDIAAVTVQTVFTLYVLVLSVISIGYTDVSRHGRFIVHISALSTAAFVLLSAISILPLQDTLEKPQRILWYITLALWFIAFWLVTHTKRGPALHFPSSQIYSQKTIAGTTSFAEDNVCGVSNASPWDYILFSYTTKVVMLGYTAESLEIGDLPIVTADMRSTIVFANMRAALKRHKFGGIFNWRPSPGSGWQLAFRILRVNARAFFTQISLVMFAAGLFYSPALFLRQLVKYLEDDPQRLNPEWGWVYCAGLVAFNVLQYLGMMSFVDEVSSPSLF